MNRIRFGTDRSEHAATVSWLILLVVVVLLLLAAPANAAGTAAPEGVAPLELALATPDQARTDDPELEFDAAALAAPQQGVSGQLSVRRGMLLGHQALGAALLGVNVAATVVGQLNYNDKFVSGAPTGRYESAHKTLAWATVGTFAATGALAVFAPSPPHRPSQGFDRVSLHKVCMATATAAMIGQAALGMATAGREGQINQADVAKAHLALGYFTLAALAVGFGALVF